MVIIIGAAGLLLAYTASFVSINQLETSYIGAGGLEALSVTEGCVEETLNRIRLDNNYGVGAGSINLSLGDGSCIIDVTDLGGGNRRIEATGTVSNFQKKVQVELSVSGSVISVTQWEELTN